MFNKIPAGGGGYLKDFVQGPGLENPLEETRWMLEGGVQLSCGIVSLIFSFTDEFPVDTGSIDLNAEP